MLKVSKILIDRQENPAALSEPTPYLGWQLESDRRNVHQTAYRICIRDGLRALPGTEVQNPGRQRHNLPSPPKPASLAKTSKTQLSAGKKWPIKRRLRRPRR